MVISINPYIITNGNGQEAVTFYQNALDAKVLAISTYGELPSEQQSQIPKEFINNIIHAHLKIGESDLMLSDTFPGPHQVEYIVGSNINIALNIQNVDKSKELFDNLSVDGQIIMNLQETFFSPAYGQVKDKFGVTWHVSTAS